MKKSFLIIACSIIIAQSANAQDEYDALRYENSNYYGTARGLSIGNAMGSVGGDFSSLSINPAGIGIYRRGEFVFSPSFQINNNSSTYLNNTTTSSTGKLNIAQFGVVFTNAKKGNQYKRSAWKTSSFAFGMNRIANFKNSYSYSGNNFQSSLIEKYADEFNQLGGIKAINSVSLPAYAAYQTWLIDRGYGADSNKAVSYVPFNDGIKQTKTVTENGSMQEYVISFGGNYQEKLMLGATIGIPRITYNRTINYKEEDISGNLNNDFKSFEYTENLKTIGTGVNLKLGAIVKPNDNFRLGLALHTPSIIQFNDVSSIQMTSNTDSLLLHQNPNNSPITTYNQDTALAFNYSQTTPYKAILSGTVLFNQYGFLSADIEYIDYASMKYNYGIGYETMSNSINNTIHNTYKGTINARIGGEAKLQNVSLRAGVAYYGSPYKLSTYDASKLNLSAGIGFRAQNWFIDLAYIYSNQKYTQNPYTLTNKAVPTAEIKNNTSNVVCTLGFKF